MIPPLTRVARLAQGCETGVITIEDFIARGLSLAPRPMPQPGAA